MAKTYPRARIKAKDEEEFRRWEKLCEKLEEKRSKGQLLTRRGSGA